MTRIANIIRADELQPGDVVLNPNHPAPWWQRLTIVGTTIDTWPGTNRERVSVTYANTAGVRSATSLLPAQPAGKMSSGAEVWAGRIVTTGRTR